MPARTTCGWWRSPARRPRLARSLAHVGPVGRHGPVFGVPFVMRGVTLWASTVPFFGQRGAELAEFETGMRYMDQLVLPTWRSSRLSRTMTPPTGSVASACQPWCWRSRRTSSSPSHGCDGSMRRSPARNGPRPRAVTPASGSTWPTSTGPSLTSSDGTERASGDPPGTGVPVSNGASLECGQLGL